MIQAIIALVVALIVAVCAIFGLKNKEAIMTFLSNNKKIIDEVKTLANKIDTNNQALIDEAKIRALAQVNVQQRDEDLAKAANAYKEPTPDDLAAQQNILDFFNKDGKK